MKPGMKHGWAGHESHPGQEWVITLKSTNIHQGVRGSRTHHLPPPPQRTPLAPFPPFTPPPLGNSPPPPQLTHAPPHPHLSAHTSSDTLPSSARLRSMAEPESLCTILRFTPPLLAKIPASVPVTPLTPEAVVVVPLSSTSIRSTLAVAPGATTATGRPAAAGAAAAEAVAEGCSGGLAEGEPCPGAAPPPLEPADSRRGSLAGGAAPSAPSEDGSEHGLLRPPLLPTPPRKVQAVAAGQV